jgi:tetratricopeptide (TPR) repeat protein
MIILTSLARRGLVVAACCLATPLAAQEIPISTRTESARSLFFKARDNFHLTRFTKARDLLEETLEKEPDLAIAHAYLALAESFTYRDPEPSLAAARDPAARASSGERLMAEALGCFLENDFDGAVSNLLAVLTTFPDDPYARHALGFTLVDLGAPEDGIEVLEGLLADRPDFIAAWNHLGYGYLDVGDLEQALGCLHRFAALAPENPSARDSLADALAAAGRIDEAIASLTRALLLDPRYAYAQLHMGDVLAVENELAMARAAYRRALEIDSSYGPEFAIVGWHRIAQTWLHGLDFEAAQTTYRTIIDLSDKVGSLHDALDSERMLMITFLVQIDGQAARNVLDSVRSRLDHLPESDGAHYSTWLSFLQGWLGVVERDGAEVDRMVDVLEADPTRELSVRLAERLRGEAALADLRFEDAASHFESARSSDPVVLVRLAMAYDGLGRLATASALFNEAVSCDTFEFECALARALAQPLGWAADPFTEPFDWEPIPPDSEGSTPDTIARLRRRQGSSENPTASPTAEETSPVAALGDSPRHPGT